MHAYEPGRLGMITTTIQSLASHYTSRFLILSATLPHPIRSQLADCLPAGKPYKPIPKPACARYIHLTVNSC